MHLHNLTLFNVVFVLSFVIFSFAELRTRCGNGSETNLTFTPSKDGVAGRYTAELCTNVTKNVTQWKLDVMINKNGCTVTSSNRTHYFKPGEWHSQYITDVNVTSLNCTHVCLSSDFDLIFDSCYLLKSTLKYGRIDAQPYDSYHRIRNQFNSGNIIALPKIIINNYESGVSFQLYPGVPPTEYLVHMYNGTEEAEVTQNCTSTPTSSVIKCFLSPTYGCYNLVFTFYPPWASGIFSNKTFIEKGFCHKQVAAPKISGDSWGVLWWCGGVLALCACACAARWALRTRTADKIKEQVRATWIEHRSDTEAVMQQNKGACKHILLLYARECELGQRAVAQLKTLLTPLVSGTVYDLFSPEAMCAAAAAPAQWTRDLLERPDVRVVLLQTPALACLYQARPDDTEATFKLCSPLLGGRVALRSPHFGDTLLHFALRLIAETAHRPGAYTKFYLAQLSELKVEIFPQIVRFTRYQLPEATIRLLRDVSSQASWDPPEDALHECTQAINHFVEYATNNPNYLMDELIFV